MHEPSGDELIRHVSREDVAARSSSPVLDPAWKNEQNRQRTEFPGDPLNSKRTGSPPDAPSSQRQKVSWQDERQRSDQAFAGKRRAEEPDLGSTVTITDADIAHAGDHSLLGWPESGALAATGSLRSFGRILSPSPAI